VNFFAKMLNGDRNSTDAMTETVFPSVLMSPFNVDVLLKIYISLYSAELNNKDWLMAQGKASGLLC